jgi:hypothetical protein
MSDEAALQKQSEEDAMAAEWAAALADAKPSDDQSMLAGEQTAVDSVAPAKFTAVWNSPASGAASRTSARVSTASRRSLPAHA